MIEKIRCKMTYGSASLNRWVLGDHLKVCSDAEALMCCRSEGRGSEGSVPQGLVLGPGGGVRRLKFSVG